LTVTVKVSTA